MTQHTAGACPAPHRPTAHRAPSSHALGAVALACAAALALLAAPHVAFAQTASVASTAPLQVLLPAQPLAQTLSALSRQWGVAIGAEGALLSGKNAPALEGRLTLQQALERALADSGLTSVRSGPDTISIRKLPDTPQAGAKELPTVTVTADSDGRGTTENTGSYTTRSMNTATRLDLSMRETPQAVTVMTRQRIEDQGLASVTDVVQSAPGLTYRRFGPERSSFYARGMTVDNVMYDGLPVSLDSSYLSQDLLQTDMAIYDRVEIVRGATGLATGAGNPAAAINLVRKRPTKEAQVSITESAGNWDRYRTEIDASGPLDADGSLRGRVVGAYQDNKSYKDGQQSNRKLLYGILEKDIDARTLLTLSASRQEDNLDGNGFTGLPVARDGSDLHLPRSTSLANAWDYWNKSTTTLYGGIEHRFDNDWRLHLSAYHSSAGLDMLGDYIGMNVLTGNYTQYASRNLHKEKQDSYDFYASGPFELLGRKHDLVIGGNYRKVDFDGNTRQGSILVSGLDPSTWMSGAVAKPDIPLRNWLDSNIEQKSIYATTRLQLADPLKLILGARLDWYDYKDAVYAYANFAADTPSSVTHNQYGVDHNLTQYAGLVYDIDGRHSVYASYTDIFKPQNYLDANQQLLDPIKGKNYEIGIKGEYFGGALNTSATLFRLDQANRAYKLSDQTACSGYPSQVCYAAAGLVRSQGVELEAQGAVSENWQIGAGYTYTNARYRKDANPLNIGQLFDTDTPRQLFKFSSTYRLTGDWQRWRIGGSVYWQGTIYNEGTSSGVAYRVEQKSYAVADLMIGYQATPRLDLRLNINNLFDKVYYNAITGSITFPSNVYGDPRSVTLTMNYRF